MVGLRMRRLARMHQDGCTSSSADNCEYSPDLLSSTLGSGLIRVLKANPLCPRESMDIDLPYNERGSSFLLVLEAR